MLLLAIFLVTDGPISFRPTFGHANAERFIALAMLGFAFSLAYPRRTLIILVFLAGAVCGFEYLQHFVSYRHGTERDALIKLAGILVGVAGGAIVTKLTARFSRLT